MNEKLLKPADVAQILGISQAKAYTMLRRGMIPKLMIGSLVRVRKVDLDQFILDMKQDNTNTLPKA
jgi:excisionase family DNA binding protein